MTPEDYEDAVFKHALEVSCEEPMAEAYARGFNAGLKEGVRIAEDYAHEWKDSDFEPPALTICNAIRARLSQKEKQ